MTSFVPYEPHEDNKPVEWTWKDTIMVIISWGCLMGFIFWIVFKYIGPALKQF